MTRRSELADNETRSARLIVPAGPSSSGPARSARAQFYARFEQACRESGKPGVDNSCHMSHDATMSRQTMSFALPESMREYIDARVAAGNYGNTSEYIRDLVRKDQEEQAKKRLRDLVEEGLASGPGHPRTKADDKELLAIARGEID